MVMGTEFREVPNQLFSGAKLDIPHPFALQDQFLDLPFTPQTETFASDSSILTNSSPEGESHDDSEIFSDIALNYITQMLMDENVEVDNFQALEATEKPFYEILGEKYPPDSAHNSSESPDSSGGQFPLEFYSRPMFGVRSDGLQDPGLFLESLQAWHFNKGVEEARKFLPSDDKLVIDVESSWRPLPVEEPKQLVEVKSEFFGPRGRKNPHGGDLEEGRRSVKQTAVSSQSDVRTEMFDEVLLCHGDMFPKAVNDLREALQHVVASKSSQSGSAKGSGSGGGKRRGKRSSPTKREVVDLRTLLVQCAQMVAADDQRSTNEVMKQIRQHADERGDGSQRLAHHFANGIQARLAGTGSELYNSYRIQQRTATDFLKAYRLFLAVCPFKKIAHFFSNQTIMNVTENASRIHVIDYGINFGFQWPSLIQRLGGLKNGPPKLRITGIDLPLPGFRPAERIEETGRRLADYARSFNVPFEYKAIATKWEDVRIEDLNIDRDEVLVVNCLFQMRYLPDETVMVDSPRNTVLKTIRKMNPDVFIHGIVNGSYSAPFFVTRFREALYHYSALFDMLETVVPREDEQRQLIEREIFGREILNIIACEGLERMERPETYKQWQVRNQRAGFVQARLNEEILKKARDKVKKFYHKDFNVDEDSKWLLQSWKGRIVFALSTWRPNNV